MSEFWVSKKKYFCKYCEIYIADDAPSRQQHENGLRHKGNKDRFIRDLYKGSERKKKDKEEEDREMQRIDQAARAAFAKDTGKFTEEPSTSKPKPKPVAAKSSDPYANYSTAESLGFKDEEMEAIKAEAELRQNEGTVGEWKTVSLVSQDEAPLPSSSSAGVKRARTPLPPEGVPEEEDTRRFKVKQRTAAVGLGEIWDPGVIKVKRKDEQPTTKKEEETSVNAATNVPSWQPVQWKKSVKQELVEPTDSDTITSAPIGENAAATASEAPIKEEPIPEPEVPEEKPPTEAAAPTAEDPASSAGTGMFRKRKIATKSTQGKRRKI